MRLAEEHRRNIRRALMRHMAQGGTSITFHDATTITSKVLGYGVGLDAYRIADRSLQYLRKNGLARTTRKAGNSWAWSLTDAGRALLQKDTRDAD